MLLVMAFGLAVAGWTTRSLDLHLAGLARTPAALGFTMWSGHPIRGHPGKAAPLFSTPGRQPICDPEHATFVLGLAELKLHVGEAMGDPVECEHAVDADGNTAQLTTTGHAEYLQRAQISTFTDGVRRWTLTGGKLSVRDAASGPALSP